MQAANPLVARHARFRARLLRPGRRSRAALVMSQVGHVSSAFAKLVADAVPSVTADKLPPEASPFDPNWLDGADADAGRKTPLIGPEIGPEVSNRSESRVSRHHLSPRTSCNRGTFLIWARVVSNHRPLACEASALPLSYAPGRVGEFSLAGSGRACPDRRRSTVAPRACPFGTCSPGHPIWTRRRLPRRRGAREAYEGARY
jgi:hypothetical protein